MTNAPEEMVQVLSNLTPAVSRALDVARQFAGNADSIDPTGLLHGLLSEEDGAATALARRAGLDYERYLEWRGEPGASADVPLSAESEALLFDARELAHEWTGEGILTSESLLLALVRRVELPGVDRARLEALLQAAKPAPLVIEEPIFALDQSERISLARILDATYNRAREALRVLEDHARFALDDRFLSEQLKHLRHELTTAFAEAGPQDRYVARETQHDVGVDLTAEREFERTSLAEVVTANCKRLQEALRSLEEFAKINAPLLAERVERMRYTSYVLERALILGQGSRSTLQQARLYLLATGATCESSLEWTIAEAAAGGVSIVQLREKSLTDRQLIDRARQVRRWTRQAGVLFVVNDRPDVARLVGADGVHLGQDDLSVKEARTIVGPEAILGVSTHSLEQLRQAILDGVNYVGVGPVFPSSTKSFGTLAGLEFVRAAAAETTLPAFAIGGIHADNVEAVREAGLSRIAVSAAILASSDPRSAARELLAKLTHP